MRYQDIISAYAVVQNYNPGFSHVIYRPSQAVHFPNYSDLTTEAVATPQTVEALRSPWERTWLRFAGQAWLHAAEPVGRSEGQPSPANSLGSSARTVNFYKRGAFVSTNAKMEKSGVVRPTIWVATFGPRPPSALGQRRSQPMPLLSRRAASLSPRIESN